MDFKRKVFLLFSFVSLILPFVISHFAPGRLGYSAYILLPILFYMIYFLMQMLSLLALNISRNSRFIGLDEYYSFLFGIILINQKRIYYSDLGYFYMSGKSKLTIWNQGYFTSNKLFHVYYNGDIEQTTYEIKSKLEAIYQEELEENRKRKLLKDWNGYLDKKSERDDKLNKLLK